MTEPVLLITDECMLDHDAGSGHPERPARLRAVLDSLRAEPVDGVEWVTPAPATRAQLVRVHDGSYLDRLESLRGERVPLDSDTVLSPGSVHAAQVAAGAAVMLVDRLLAGPMRRAFALVRPPGHHAECAYAMGFCLYSSVAVAAAHAVATGCRRVLIVDWDVHHGNGTQHLLEERDDILVFGSHRAPPFFPGTGSISETGLGRGAGYTFNLPYAPGTGDEAIVASYRTLLPALGEAYRPELVLVSAGFDAHGDDPLGGCRMTATGFAALCALTRDVADEHAGGRLGLVLEGGYALDALARSTRACLEILAGAPAPEIAEAPPLPGTVVLLERAAILKCPT